MSIGSLIGTGYVAIGLVHFVIYVVKAVYSEPEELVIVTFAWPLVDILWLRAKHSNRNRK